MKNGDGNRKKPQAGGNGGARRGNGARRADGRTRGNGRKPAKPALAPFEPPRELVEEELAGERFPTTAPEELVTAEYVAPIERPAAPPATEAAPAQGDEIATLGPAPGEVPRVLPPGAPAAEAAAPGGRVTGALRHIKSAIWIKGIGARGGYGSMPLIAITLLAFASEFDANAFTQLLPEIQQHFELNLRSLITIFTYIGIVGILFTGPVGYLGDRWRRTTMTAIGGLMAASGSLLTAFAPNKPGLITIRSFGTQGDILSSPAYFSLLADYYPLEERGRAFAFRDIGTNVGAVLAPLLVGLIAVTWGWQAPFIMIGVVGLIIAALFFLMPEPTRGYHERKEHGVDEETARREEEPPSWGEAWRAARSIRTLRRISYSIPFTTLANRGIGIFLFLYVLPRVHALDELQRGYVLSALSAAGIVGLMIGGPLVSRLLRRNPGKVMMLNGLAGIVGSLAIMGIALTRDLTLAMICILVYGVVDYVIFPSQLAVSSAVIPARLRGLGRATLNYWRLPALMVGLPIVAYIATEFGARAGIVILTPVAIVGAIIQMTAGPFVEFDIRSATSAAMASEAWRRAKQAGRGKMLVIRDLDVHYDTVQVLFDVDLDVDEGEILALLGTNGAGKSTLLRAISGTQEASGGAIVFNGRDVTHVPPHEIVRHGVVHLPGGRGVFPGLSVRENLMLAGWMYGDDPKHAEEVEQALAFFPVLRERMQQQAGTLSGGEQQMLALAQVFLSRPKMLMIDELSLGLAPAVVEQLLEIIRAIHERGTTIILVEQSVNVALTVAKRAVFMEKGEVRFDGPTEELLSRPDIMRAVFLKGSSALSATTLGSGAAQASLSGPRRSFENAPAVLSLENITKSYGGVSAVNGASFDLLEGEILGLIGPNGAGKTTALEIASGFVMPDSGRVVYEGHDITALPPDQRARLRLIRRFQDARLFPSLTVAETIAVAFERQFEVRSIFIEGLQLPQSRVNELRIRRRVDRLIELLELGDYQEKFVSELSTGTRRVVDLACVLAAEPKVLLLDEPTSGMAQREAENLVPLLLRVRTETGCSMMVVEHDMPVISALADELLAMNLGTVLTRGAPREVLEDDRVVQAYLGTTEEVIVRSGTGVNKT